MTTTTTTPTVLFVCVHNAGRSQMAAGFLGALAGDRVEVLSAGSEPKDRINTVAVEAMAEHGIDIAAAVPRILTTDAVRASDAVITMGCGDACPIFPGKRYEDWELEDPAGQGIEVVRRIRDDIEERIAALFVQLVPAEASELPDTIGSVALEALGAHGFTRFEQLTRVSPAALLRIPGVDPEAVDALTAALAARSLTFAS
jgi:arsenate reductase